MGEERGANNGIPVLFSILASIMSIGILLNAIWLNQQVITQCDHVLDIPLIIISSFLIALSIFGIFASFKGIYWILRYYGCALFILILLMYASIVFILGVTDYIEVEDPNYTIGKHRRWLYRRVNHNWNKITSFLQQTKICDIHSHNANLYSIQSHCCNPSKNCSNPSFINPDCTKWSSDPKGLCYGCESCKIAWKNIVGYDWRKVAINNFVLLFLIVACTIVIFQTVKLK
ncbi:tetraspanin-8-like [Impatiens glandulifera]|uniref:tetraspanin-8-like n=1 Tax=Impatiens glandulifera TaxID=253017 RepID=UPI001FB06C96|nr:tetraspanin-8-like [Impatiens glandulifera]